MIALLLLLQTAQAPVLAFPERGLDDPAAYQGYETRFYRDASGNTVQIYLEPRGGRVVNLWADALDESVGFTVRDAAGRPVRLEYVDGNARAARFYARQGFTEIRREPGEEPGWPDTVWVEKPVP